jgi:LysR family transcriptional regulator, glycine cleavage system transcriptional activator
MNESHEVYRARRSLPPLSALIAFEAAARQLSFTRAGEELSLTQSAISRQIALLEEMLGVPLFERVRQRVALTPAGRFYADRVRDALARLTAVTQETIAFRGRGGILRLGVLPTFGTRWLIPRLGRFFDAHPEVTVNFTTRLPGIFDFSRENLDATIHVGAPEWPGAILHRLTKGEIVAVAAPKLVRSLRIEKPEDLRRATLLIHRSQPDAWAEWFTANRLGRIGAQAALEFEQFTMLFQAAIAKLGVAIAPTFLAHSELSAGDLIPLFEPILQGNHGDFLAYPVEKKDFAPVAAFRDWILAEAGAKEAPRPRRNGR